jgi:hypothetical protein
VQNKFTVTREQYTEIDELIAILRCQLLEDEIGVDPQMICSILHRIVYPESTIKNQILQRVFEENRFTIDSCDGTETFLTEEMFNHVNWGIHAKDDQPQRKRKATPRTEVEVYRPIKSATTFQVFTSLSEDLEELRLTEHQSINFCKKYYSFLYGENSSFPTLFLRKKGKNFFVVRVFRGPSGDLSVCEDYMKKAHLVDSAVRIVVPKLAPRD